MNLKNFKKYTDYKDINWVHYLSRPKEFFQMFILAKDFKGSELKKIIGCGYDKWLFTNDGGDTMDFWYSKKEAQKVFEHVRSLLHQKHQIQSLFKRATKINMEFEFFIDNFEKLSQFSNIKILGAYYKSTIQKFIQYFSYAVELPYVFGSTLEKYNLDKDPRYRYIIKKCEKFRTISLYPKYQNQVLYKLLDVLAEFLDSTREVFSLLTPEEIIGYCENKISKATLLEQSLKRENGFICFAVNGKTRFLDDTNFIKSLGSHIIDSATQILRGNSAQKGVFKGIARVVLTSKDFNKITQGDVVVTIQSNPSFLRVLKLAGAIVADEGGIMSHAAIIAREMHKPCIIGTKIATKVLKDGDLVEVDAEKGIVKIIKRAEN